MYRLVLRILDVVDVGELGHDVARRGGIALASGDRGVVGFHHSGRYADSLGSIAAELRGASKPEAAGDRTGRLSYADGEPMWLRR